MRSAFVRRLSAVGLAAVEFVLLVAMAFGAGPLSSGQLVLMAAAILFGYIVVRLSHSMFAADPARRRRARRGLLVAAAVPVLILTPVTIASAPTELAPTILIASTVWLAIAMAYTSFVLASASRSVVTEERTGQLRRAADRYPHLRRAAPRNA